MPSGYRVKPNNTSARGALVRLRTDVADLTPAMKNASEELTRRVWYRFAFKRDPDGNQWKPWSAATKRAAKPGQRLMLNSRRLRDGTRFIPAKTGLWVRFGAAYGAEHEQLDGKPRRLPRRAFIFSALGTKRGLSKADEQYLLNAVRYQISKNRKNK